MSKNYKPLLSTYDWNNEWKQLQEQRHRADSAEYWDKRSETYGASDHPSAYVDSFLGKAGILPGESIFDMGCGTGALSIPLARRGHSVIAADFSLGMLSRLEEVIWQDQLSSIDVKRMSWSDDWNTQGISENSVDVALASRSIATADLKDSLLRLSSVARRKACITLTTGSSPRIDSRIIKAVGILDYSVRDYQYALNILINEGFLPELSFIISARKDTFDSFDDALETFTTMLNEVKQPSESHPTITRITDSDAQAESNSQINAFDRDARLRNWLQAHLVPNPEAGKKNENGNPQKKLCLDTPRSNTWAFISWETS